MNRQDQIFMSSHPVFLAMNDSIVVKGLFSSYRLQPQWDHGTVVYDVGGAVLHFTLLPWRDLDAGWSWF